MEQSKTEGFERGKSTGNDYRPVRASRGPQISCNGWPQEAALRMLMNSLDEEVAEQPRELIACGVTARVLHDWHSYGETVKILKDLKNTETFFIQSGKPSGVFETINEAPRVLIVNNELAAAPWPSRFRLGETRPYALSCQAAARSWAYVGPQEALATAFFTLDAIRQKHFGGNLAGKLIISGGMGPAGGAISLAAGMHGAAFLGIDVDEERIKRRIRVGYCDYCVNALDEALRILKNAVRQKQAVSVGLVGNCAEVIPELARRGVVPDILTDLTSAYDLLNGYVPSGLSAKGAVALRHDSPDEYLTRARHSFVLHFEGMLALQRLGSIVLGFGNGFFAAAHECKVLTDAPAIPDFIEAYLQPLLSEGLVPVRWVALSGEAGDIRHLDDLVLRLFPDDTRLTQWISLARKYVRFQGLPARVCWMGEAARAALAGHMNILVANGDIKAPVVIALDHTTGNVPALSKTAPINLSGKSPEGFDQLMLNAVLKAAAGASWISIQCGESFSQAGVALIADGTPAAAEALARALRTSFIDGVIQKAAGICEKVKEYPPGLDDPGPEESKKRR